MKSFINNLIDRFIMSLMLTVAFNLLIIVSVALIGSGPEVLASVMHGWDGPDFLFVIFAPAVAGAVLLVAADAFLVWYSRNK